MARPLKYFKTLGPARSAARKRGHTLWKFVHSGYLGRGYFVGEQLPQKILVTSALVTRIKFSRKTIKGIVNTYRLGGKPERPW